MFYVAGKPTKQFLNLNEVKTRYPQLIENVHFVPLEHPRMLQEYVRSQINSRDYAWFGKTIPTIAVKAVLITYDFSAKDTSYYQMRCEQLALVARAIRENLGTLRKQGHAKWKEVNLDEQVGFWERDPCSHKASQSRKSGGLANDLEKILKQGK